jgi:hypothetical protein
LGVERKRYHNGKGIDLTDEETRKEINYLYKKFNILGGKKDE